MRQSSNLQASQKTVTQKATSIKSISQKGVNIKPDTESLNVCDEGADMVDSLHATSIAINQATTSKTDDRARTFQTEKVNRQVMNNTQTTQAITNLTPGKTDQK